MSIPSVLPEWNTTEVNSVEPDATHKAQGWLAPGGIPEKPPFETFNFWQNSVYKWINYFTTEARRLWQRQAVTHNITVDTDYQLTATQNSYGRIIITDTGVVLTTARNIIVDTSEREFIVQNDTLQDLTVKTSAGTGIVVKTGGKIPLLCDGTDVVEPFISGGSGQMLGTADVKAINYNAQTIAENITIPAAYNASSVGPITISTGFTVTVETGARWVIL